jgi:hypothetical protein
MQLLQIKNGVGVRRFHRRGGWRRRWRARSHLYFFCGRSIAGVEVRSDFVSEIVIECAGVRFLVLDPYFS